jgi:hypothetical protein
VVSSAVASVLSDLRRQEIIESSHLFLLGNAILRDRGDKFDYVSRYICGSVVLTLATRLESSVDDIGNSLSYDHLFDLIVSVLSFKNYQEAEEDLCGLIDLTRPISEAH